MSKKAVILLSGGIDSSTLAYYLKSHDCDLHPIFIKYGQRHSKELESAKAIALSLGLKLKVADISTNKFLFSGSAITDDDIEIPESTYDKESMQVTIVNNRNMIFLALATAYAQAIGADTISYAAHSADHWLYPDCRLEFIESMKASISLATDDEVNLYTPLAIIDKVNLVREGLKLGVPFELTWSCYQGLEKACGKCGTCVERLNAFEKNNITDPIPYEE